MKILYEDTVFEMMKSLNHNKLRDEKELYQKFDHYVSEPKLKDRLKFNYGLEKDSYDPYEQIYGMVLLVAYHLIDWYQEETSEYFVEDVNPEMFKGKMNSFMNQVVHDIQSISPYGSKFDPNKFKKTF